MTVPTAAAAPQSEGTRRRRFGQRESKGPCFRDASILLVMIAAAGEADGWTCSRLGPAADSEPPPPRAPPAVARLGPPCQRRADFARQFPLGAFIGNALTLAGFRGFGPPFSFSPLARETRAAPRPPRPG